MSRFDPFAVSGPRWYAVEARRPFLEDLAAGVLAWIGERPPEALSDAVILLPNRRAARAFGDALTRQAAGRAVLLPQVRPLGDLEEDEPPFAPGELGLDLPPAIAPLTRRFEMARMIVEEFRSDLAPLRALEMADALGGFLDSCQLEEIEDLDRVITLVEGDLAEHWRESARFLGLAVETWPKRLAAMGLVDPAWRRARLLRLLADQWAEHPPQSPVIAAGSTGTAPAAAAVLAAVAAAPHGCVVLPGLDRDLDPAVWARLGDNEQHPQNALWRLLHERVAREDVRPWFTPPEPPAAALRGRARQRLINEALRPAEATDDWRNLIRRLRAEAAGSRSADPIAGGLEGLSVVTARTEEDAAAAIALMMRETLETPDKTCALVTPDLELGRRVAARLERWGVSADVSSGQPLARMTAGRLVDLCARFLAEPLDPHTLLGLLKHPSVRLDLGEIETRTAVEALERYALRGPRQRDWSRAQRTLLKAGEPRDDGKPPSEGTKIKLVAAGRLLDRLEALSATARGPFAPAASLDQAARALTGLVEALAGQDAWAGSDGEAAAGLLSALIEGGASLGAVTRVELATLVHELLDETTVRTGGATQPRLRILGAIEARLVRADRMILAGLEEGVWPNAAPTDPFLSWPMRKAMGLPPPERRLGQTAQDFVQAACADDAVLVHCERRGGQPAVKSRWLWRLEMLTRGANAEATPVALHRPVEALEQARALDAPAVGAAPGYAPRPLPRPPVERRPRELPVTGVERWVRDPYAVYARYVLNLRQLDRPGQAAEALARGNAVHKAVERLTLAWPDVLPDDCAEQLEALLLEELGTHGFEDAAMARETPLARNCAHWLAGFEAERRARGIEIRVEQRVAMTLQGPAGPFTLTAKADRIELSATGAAVLDFKTGSVPTPKQVKTGFSPQLTLTGAILAEAGLPDGGPVTPEELTYVRVVGRKDPGQAAVRASGAEAVALSMAALDGLKKRIGEYDQVETPYASWVAPQYMGNFGGNYDHLARVWEWHVVGGDEGEGE